jgi:putative transposase
MTRKRHTEEQIIAVLKDAQAGLGVQELCRKHGISDATFFSGGRSTPASKSTM